MLLRLVYVCLLQLLWGECGWLLRVRHECVGCGGGGGDAGSRGQLAAPHAARPPLAGVAHRLRDVRDGGRGGRGVTQVCLHGAEALALWCLASHAWCST